MKNSFPKSPLPTPRVPTNTSDASTLNSVTRAVISTEYASLRYNKHCPSGMYVAPSSDSILVWDAVLFVHKGYYAGSVLKFTITFPENYPDKQPTVRVLTDIFHPLVESQNGMLNLMARFRPWRPKEHRVHDLLHFLKAMFKVTVLDHINELDVVNKEAFMYQENRTSFATLAQQSSQLSQSSSALYGSSSLKNFSLPFTPIPRAQVDEVLNALLIHRQPDPTHGN